MHVGEYIQSRFQAFHVGETQLLDFALETGIDPNSEYTPENYEEVQKAMITILEGLVLAPRLKTVNENGFSLSWDFGALGRYYLWLCRKLGITPNDDVVSALDISTITDKSDIW